MIIYDSTNPQDIPTTAEAVAGYVDGIYAWPDSGWLRFPNSVKLSIAISATSEADALDVENGDATPAQAPGWVKAQIARGIKPWVYCNRSNRSAVELACQSAGIGPTQMALWVATLDGTQSVAAGFYPVAAVQYANSTLAGGHYDLSITTAYGDTSGQLTGGDTFLAALTDTQQLTIYNFVKDLYDTFNPSLPPDGGGLGAANMTWANWLIELRAEVDEIKAKVDALSTASPSAEPKTLTIQGPITGTLA